jgi:hypothetical protein
MKMNDDDKGGKRERHHTARWDDVVKLHFPLWLPVFANLTTKGRVVIDQKPPLPSQRFTYRVHNGKQITPSPR